MATETWLLNDDAYAQSVHNNKTYTALFNSNGQTFNSIIINNNPMSGGMFYDSTKVVDPDNYATFIDQAYRTVTFATPPTGDLLTWLQNNGTKQQPAYTFKHWKKSNVVVNRTLVGEKYYYFKPYTILGLYTITTTLTNCTGASANATKIQENGDLTLTFTANSGYELPTGVSVTNVTSYNWNKSTGVLAISKPTGDVAIEIVAVSALPQLSTPTNVAVSDTTLTFDEVANATSYEVFVDNVSIGTHTIASGETWLLNETLTLQPLTVTIAFTSNNQRFNSIVITNIELKYDNTAIYAKFRPNWQNGEEYRTITFATPPTGEFLTWLQANAVKQ